MEMMPRSLKMTYLFNLPHRLDALIMHHSSWNWFVWCLYQHLCHCSSVSGCPTIYLSIFLSISLSVCLSVFQCVCMCMCLCVYMCVEGGGARVLYHEIVQTVHLKFMTLWISWNNFHLGKRISIIKRTIWCIEWQWNNWKVKYIGVVQETILNPTLFPILYE